MHINLVKLNMVTQYVDKCTLKHNLEMSINVEDVYPQ